MKVIIRVFNYINRLIAKAPEMWLVVILMATVYVGLSMAPMYQTNDDPGLILAFSGRFIFDEPVAVTAFTTKLWGLFEVWLYKKTNDFNLNIEVHTVLLIIVMTFSFFVILVNVQRRISDKRFAIVIILLVVAFLVLPFFRFLQYTMTAGIATYAGLIHVLAAGPDRAKYFKYIVCISFTGIGYLLRPDVWILFVLVTVLGFIFYNKGSYLRQFKKLVPIALIMGFSVSMIILIERTILTNEERNFIEFNKFRSSINDNNIISSVAGSHREDYIKNMGQDGIELFNQWYFSDSVLYNRSIDYRGINEGLGVGEVFQLERLIVNLGKSFRSIVNECNNLSVVLLLLTGVLLVILEFKFKTSFKFWIGLVFIFILVLFIGALSKPVPFRVLFPLFAVFILNILLFFLSDSNNHVCFNLKGYAYSGLAMATVVMIAYNFITLRNWKYRSIEVPVFKDRITLVDNSLIPFRDLDPFVLVDFKSADRVYCTGSFMVLPEAHRHYGKKYFEYFTDVILKRPNDIIIALNNPDKNEWSNSQGKKFIGALVEYYKLKYNVELLFVREKMDGNKPYASYKLKVLKHN